MPAIHVPIDKGTVYTPVPKTCRATTERGMIPHAFVWTKINDISSLWPEGQFRRVAMDAAKQFVADMARMGFDLITAEADVVVYGPVRHRPMAQHTAPTWTPAPGASPSFRASGFDIYEEHQDGAEDFLLRATFLAKKVHMAEYLIREDDPR